MRRAIVTGGTKSDLAPMAVFAINVRNTNRDLFDELVIFHNGISEKYQKLINAIFPTRFILYKYPNESWNDEVLTYFSKMVFCKYECFKLLDEYDEVVWSDYDVVLLRKLDEFCRIEDDSINIVSCTSTMKSNFNSDISSEEIRKYDLSEEAVTTPIFAIKRGLLDYKTIYEWCYNKTAKWDKDLYLPEQAVIGLAVQEFKVKLNRFPHEKYVCYPTDMKGDEVIIHAAGQPKFWNGLSNETWDIMYKEWLSMGGAKYSELKKRISRFLMLIITRTLGMRRKAKG